MSDELVKRLRKPYEQGQPRRVAWEAEAADRIEELEAKLAKAVAALGEFADAADEADEYGFDDFNQAPIDCGQCRAARATLAELEGKTDE